jgi:FkbM family methyltransferase
MNNYIEKLKGQLPLLKYCDGPGTQEDGIIRHLLGLLDLKSNYFVEFGQRSLGGGTLGRISQERQASLLNIDSEAVKDEVRTPWNDGQKWILKKQSVSPLNINQLFDECEVPGSPAACVIDVDGMDYWCMLAILQKRRPSLLICEYNCHVPADVSASLSFNPSHQYKRDKNYGASLLALSQLARNHGYRLAHIHGPLNLYFIPEDSKAWEGVEEGLDLNGLTNDDLAGLSNTNDFYESFHPGQRPSWYESEKPSFNQPPWIRLDRIGERVQTISIDEIKLTVYVSDQGGDHYKQRGHKEDSVSPLWRLIRNTLEPEVVIDIGANYGYTAAMLCSRLGAKRLIAIEPDPRLLPILRENLKQITPDCRAEIVQAAVSSQESCVTAIGVNPVSTQDNRVVAQKNWQEVIVPVTSLDKILGSVPRPNRLFIKSDTQGFDVSVIRSGFRELSRRSNWMVRCEFAPHWMESQGFSPVSELEWLCVNFRVFEAPLRTPWNSRLKEVFKRPIEACQATCFVDYVKSLNHQCMGWVDLYLTSPNSELPLKIAEAPNSLSS